MTRRSAEHVCARAGFPSPYSQNATLTIALRMVRNYGSSIPTIEMLQADFGLSRATAYRWRAAFRESLQMQGQAEVIA